MSHNVSSSQTLKSLWNLRLRSDIRWSCSDEASGKVWIATDSLHRAHFRCSEQDYHILQWLEGSTSIESLVNRFNETFRPRRMTAQTIVRFLSQCESAGVIRGTVPAKEKASVALHGKSEQANPTWIIVRGIAQWILKIFQMRLSLGNPDRLVQSLAMPFLFLFTVPAFVACAIAIVVSASLVVMRTDDLVSQMPNWNILRSPSALIGFGVIFILTRIIHEFGHAVACKRFGVPCKDVGLLISFGMICPYVDITDAWSVGSRGKRIVIAMGGIYFESIIAAVAGFAWCFTVDSWVHDQLFRIMIVTSATTLLFNANPFLKYDGYFVLSDCTGIQNIRERSWQSFDAFCEGRVVNSLLESVGLSVYFLLALANRLSMSVGLAVFVYALACQWHLAGLGVALFLLYAFSAFALSIGSWLSGTGSNKRLSRRSHWIGWSAVACLIAWAVTMPLPNRFWATGELIVGSQRPIHAKERGIVVQSVAHSSSILAAGSSVLELENSQIEKELVTIESKWLQANQQYESAVRNAFQDPRLLETLPQLESQCQAIQTQRREIAERRRALQIATTSDGLLVLEDRAIRDLSQGLPSGNANSMAQRIRTETFPGELVMPGELIGHVLEKGDARIECLISDEDANCIRIGTIARVRIHQLPTHVTTGIIEEISRSHQSQSTRHNVSDANQPESRVAVSLRISELDFNPIRGGSAEVVFVCEKKSILDRAVDAGLRNLRWR